MLICVGKKPNATDSQINFMKYSKSASLSGRQAYPLQKESYQTIGIGMEVLRIFILLRGHSKSLPAGKAGTLST